MGKRLSDIFLAAKPRAAARTLVLGADNTALDAGVWASFGTAAFVGVLAVGLKAGEGLSSAPEPLPTEPTPARTSPAQARVIPLAEVEEQPALVQPIAYRPSGAQPAQFPSLPQPPVSREEPLTYADPLAEYYAEPEAELVVASSVVYVPPQIDIRRPRYGDGETVLAVATRRAPINDGGVRGAAEAILQDVATTWQAPDMRDLSFFVASGDEAISWSFTEASPNHGAIAYDEARVEVGEASAGIALSVDSAQVALAHVQTQDVSFWGQRQEEDYSGVILTMKF
jgi:hypothetical protein